jgi:DNA-binding transcriptional LysR family regulator
VTLQQLRYFLAAARLGTFSAAADALYMAQPSLAEQIRRLEAELGVTLFSRTGRKLVLTEAGELLRPHAERTIAAAEQAAAAVAPVKDLLAGTASLGTFANGAHYIVRELVAEFSARHPAVSVRVVGQNSVEVIAAIRSGELDAGLITLPIDAHGLEVRPVMTDENVFVASEGLAEDVPVTIEDLARMRLILYDAHFGWNDPTRRQLADRARAAGLELRMSIEVEHSDSAIWLASQGLGGTFISETITRAAWFPSNLIAARFDPPLYDTFAFVWRKGQRLPPATAELLRVAEALIARFNRPPHPSPLAEGAALTT